MLANISSVLSLSSGTQHFMSHGYCYMWNPLLIRLHACGDLVIGLSYVIISTTLGYFVCRAHKSIPFQWIFIAFGMFIIACGTTHLIEVWTIWIPVYWFAGIIKALAATVSIITALALPHYVPQALALIKAVEVSGARKRDLEASNIALMSEVERRRISDEEIRRLNEELDRRVQERTRQLAVVDSTLKSTIDELRKSEQRSQQLGNESFRLILDSIPQLAWIADSKGWILWYNQRWYDYTGTVSGQLTGWEWASVHDEKVLPAVLARWRWSVKTGEPFEMEFPLRGADGRFRMFMTRVLPVRDSAGSVSCWVGTNTDVEEHRVIEERLHRLYDSGIMGVFYWSANGAIIDANDKFLEIVEYSRQELQAGEIDWIRLTPEEFAAQDQHGLRELRQGGMIKPIEKEFFRKNGTRVPIELGAASTEGTPGVDGFAFVRDISQRKLAEARLADLNHNLEERVLARTAELDLANQKLAESRASLRAVLDGATEVAIIATDADGIITEFNSGAERMLQYRANDVVGIHSIALLHSPPECADRAAALSVELGREVNGFGIFSEPVRSWGCDEREWCYVRQDCTTLCVNVSRTAIRDASNRITGFLAIANDITARKSLERELRDRNLLLERGVRDRTEELESALVEKTVLLKEIHHRVKNNLAVVASLLGMQADTLDSGAAARALLESQRRVHSMALIHEHLYGTKDLTCIPFDEYADELATELYIAFSSPGNIELVVRAEPIELPIDKAIPCGLILNELITNALKYAFPETRSGTVEVLFAEKTPGLLTLTVNDNGIGFPLGLDWPQSDSLGLKIVQILSRQIEGSISVDGLTGTRFEIAFPA